jgi:ABC-type multidrug transport system ATPase subunit
MEFVDVAIYAAVLWVLETVRVVVARRGARRSFGDYGDFFKAEKAKHPVTDEAKQMEEEVANCREYAVRVVNCSRLFFNTAGSPIPAVNCVSLGVKQGSLFGFLGANGAGKTTLIKMITSMLPTSDGTIEIMGRDIAEFNDPTLLSICPQFNTHLCDEMTPYEHFVLYSLLFQLSPEETEAETNRLISILDLEPIRDKPLRELSGGDVRKLAIALSFLGPAKIVLLDEPTASLDAVARRHVHEIIVNFKNEKTFMLCTHLLSEAESLCDMISIMIKGCVYTVGSPGYLSDKFGTEYKVDVMLVDETAESGEKCDAFFRESLPSAKLSITRPKARIYNVPAADFTLPQLFTVMEKGKQGNCGFCYYTCSSSSLERVFMEIVRMSETDDTFVDG